MRYDPRILLAVVLLLGGRAFAGEPPAPGQGRPVAAAVAPDRAHRATAPADGPFIRFWRGFRLSGLDALAFRDRLVKEFVPSTLVTPGRFGLTAYLVALPPGSPRCPVPDEVALVVYRDEDSYRRMNDTAAGKAYQESHWRLFARERSFSLVPRPFEAGPRFPPERGVSYDVLGGPVDWHAGLTLFFFGLRKASVPPANFPAQLKRHISYVRSTFGPRGLRGYLVLMTADYEIAFLNWENEAAMQRAMSSPEGKAVVRDAGSILDTHMWVPVKRYDGWLEPGECSDVRLFPPSDRMP